MKWLRSFGGVGSKHVDLDMPGSTPACLKALVTLRASLLPLQPCFLKDWEMHVHFKVHGTGKKNLHGDGIALWYTRDRLVPGPVFGSKDNFHGLAIFLDTYPNDETTEVGTPLSSAGQTSKVWAAGLRLGTRTLLWF